MFLRNKEPKIVKGTLFKDLGARFFLCSFVQKFR